MARNLYTIDVTFRDYGLGRLRGLLIIAPNAELAIGAAKAFAGRQTGKKRFGVARVVHGGTIDAIVR